MFSKALFTQGQIGISAVFYLLKQAAFRTNYALSPHPSRKTWRMRVKSLLHVSICPSVNNLRSLSLEFVHGAICGRKTHVTKPKTTSSDTIIGDWGGKKKLFDLQVWYQRKLEHLDEYPPKCSVTPLILIPVLVHSSLNAQIPFFSIECD